MPTDPNTRPLSWMEPEVLRLLTAAHRKLDHQGVHPAPPRIPWADAFPKETTNA